MEKVANSIIKRPQAELIIPDYRYERKFFISELTKDEVESLVRLHPAWFSEIYNQRFVNNIYFDSLNLTNYLDNIEGSTQRTKYRIRWYGDLFGNIEKPILELKIKEGLLGTKESYPLSSFNLDDTFDSQTITDIINKSDIPEIIKTKLKYSNPIILNRYSRKYFQSINENYRITIDTNLSFYRISSCNNTFLNKMIDKNNIILELKYNQDMDNGANYIVNCFPFRLTKSSKYVSGIESLYL